MLGPGPGDPLDGADRKISALRSIAAELVRGGTPVLAVCLGHQILASVLGFALVRRDVPNQGGQQEIDLFGRAVRVGFYNTFTARCHLDRVPRPGVGQVEVSRALNLNPSSWRKITWDNAQRILPRHHLRRRAA